MIRVALGMQKLPFASMVLQPGLGSPLGASFAAGQEPVATINPEPKLSEGERMKYIIEPIGAQFRDKDLPALGNTFSAKSDQGYRLHSVFQVSQPGCLGMGQPTITYLAVYEKDD